VLGLAVVFESDDLCLLTFDNEHHRLSLLHADAAHVPQTENERHPHGVPFDPDKLATKLHSGVPVTELLKQGSTD
jgi:hypothetical protein